MTTNAQIIRGRTAKIVSQFWLDKDNGIVADLTGATIKCLIKASPRDADADALITKQTGGSGITITSASGGTCETVLLPTDTAIPASYNKVYFEVVAKLADGSLIGSGVDDIDVLGNVLKTLF